AGTTTRSATLEPRLLSDLWGLASARRTARSGAVALSPLRPVRRCLAGRSSLVSFLRSPRPCPARLSLRGRRRAETTCRDLRCLSGLCEAALDAHAVHTAATPGRGIDAATPRFDCHAERVSATCLTVGSTRGPGAGADCRRGAGLAVLVGV